MFTYLTEYLTPFQNTFGITAGTLTALQFFSGFFMVWEICQQKCSKTVTPMPFVGGFVVTAISLKLSYVMEDSKMFAINFIGLIVNAIFLSIYYYYAIQSLRKKLHLKLLYGVGFICVATAYSRSEDSEKNISRLSTFITILLVSLILLPLLNIIKIITHRNTENLPFPYLVSSVIVGLSWILYGLSVKNYFLACQNVFLLVLTSIQLIIYVLYPKIVRNESVQETLEEEILQEQENVNNENAVNNENTENNENELLSQESSEIFITKKSRKSITPENSRRDIDNDSNASFGTPEYEAEVCTTQPRRSNRRKRNT